MSLIEEYSKRYRNSFNELFSIKIEIRGVLKSMMKRSGGKDFLIVTPSQYTKEPWLFAEIYYSGNLVGKLDMWGALLVYNADAASSDYQFQPHGLEKGIEKLVKMYNV